MQAIKNACSAYVPQEVAVNAPTPARRAPAGACEVQEVLVQEEMSAGEE
jgi:hypothetical protein